MNIPDSVNVHPQALVESEHIGEGTNVWAFAHVMKGARIGKNCNISDWNVIEPGSVVGDGVTMKYYVIVGEAVTVEDGVFIGPGVYLSNDLYPRSPRMEGLDDVTERYSSKDNWLVKTTIKRGASIGAKASIAPGITVGEFAVIAMGAVVTKDVPAHRLMVGVPARAIGWACHCGFPLGETKPNFLECPKCDRKYSVSNDSGLVLLDG